MMAPDTVDADRCASQKARTFPPHRLPPLQFSRASVAHGPGVAFMTYIPEVKHIYYAEKGSNILKVQHALVQQCVQGDVHSKAFLASEPGISHTRVGHQPRSSSIGGEIRGSGCPDPRGTISLRTRRKCGWPLCCHRVRHQSVVGCRYILSFSFRLKGGHNQVRAPLVLQEKKHVIELLRCFGSHKTR